MRRIAEEQARDEKEVAAGQRGSISIRDENTIKHICVFFFLMLMHYDTKSDIYHKVWAMGRHEANRGRAGSPMRNDTVHFSTT
jgi:hypothetical protein